MVAQKPKWLAAAQLGLISSSFSTIISQLFAARIGRDAFVDWMTVATIPARDIALSAEPSWAAVAGGIAFHQWADFSWAMVFFGLFGRWTTALSPMQILLLAIPWAIFSSATEWFVLVPLIPFWQPLFTLQQPYWIGLLVHMTSASMYPLFAWIRWPLGEAPSTRDVRFSNRPVGVKHFQTVGHRGVDVSHGLVLLSGIGTKALPSWDPRTRRNNLYRGLAWSWLAGPSGHANSPHPSSREGHHSTTWWSLEFPPIGFDLVGVRLQPRFAPWSSGTQCRQPRCGA